MKNTFCRLCSFHISTNPKMNPKICVSPPFALTKVPYIKYNIGMQQNVFHDKHIPAADTYNIYMNWQEILRMA